MKQLLAYCLSIILCVSFTGCMENYLDLYPEDKITSASFPENESDIKLLLNGVYAQLREKEVYNQGLFGFGIRDFRSRIRSLSGRRYLSRRTFSVGSRLLTVVFSGLKNIIQKLSTFNCYVARISLHLRLPFRLL